MQVVAHIKTKFVCCMLKYSMIFWDRADWAFTLLSWVGVENRLHARMGWITKPP